MKKEEIAQWVIDNRYAKSEKEKVSDFEMYHTIIEQIEALSICEVSRSKQTDEATDIDRIRQNKWINEINEDWLKTLKEHYNLTQSIEDKTIS